MNESSSMSFATQVVDLALSKKADDLIVLDLRGLADVADTFVVATGYSEVQVQAICDAIIDGVEERALHVEGREFGKWILVDFVDVVVHIMLPEERNRYRLDRLWGDAPMLRYDETGTVVHERPATKGEDTPSPKGPTPDPTQDALS
jgi:ribosome-associated protein